MIPQLIAVCADGTTDVTPLTGQPTLVQLQCIVGGYIELVPLFNSYDDKPCVAFSNTNGKLEDLPFNANATNLWVKAVGKPTNDILVGDIAVVVGDPEFLKEM